MKLEAEYFSQFNISEGIIPYFCITREIKGTLFDRDTFFLRFDRNIVEHGISNRIIANLPMSVQEWSIPWPFSNMNRNNQKYLIIYINENNIDEKFLEDISVIKYGCIFVPDCISKNLVSLLVSNTNLPVISTSRNEHSVKGVLKIDNNVTEKIFQVWKDNCILDSNPELESGIVENLAIPDKGEIGPISMPDVKFLGSLNVTIDRMRGLYALAGEGTYMVKPSTPETMEDKEREAREWIYLYLKKTIAEKYILSLLNHEKYNILEGLCSKNNLPIIINEDSSLEDLMSVYRELSDCLTRNFDEVKVMTNMLFVLPSINVPIINNINNLLGRDKIPKKVLRKIYSNDGYYGAISQDDYSAANKDKEERNREFLYFSLREKASEDLVLSMLFTSYALGELIPYIRLPYTPTNKLYELYINLQKNSKRSDELLQIQKFNIDLEGVSNVLSHVVTKDIVKIISSNGKHIKFISDLPIEWLQTNNMPLYIEKSVSRIPILPGNSLIAHSYFTSAEIHSENLKILIMNTLEPSDNLYPLGNNLYKLVLSHLGQDEKKVVYYEPTTKEEFLAMLEETKPTVFIYYGHGSFGNKDSEGKLIIRKDIITSTELEKTNWKPLITIFGACETQVLFSNYLNVGNLFLGSGSASVLATYFPVEGTHALTFIEGLIRNLIYTLNDNSPDSLIRTWADVILLTRRSHYLLDPIYAMEEYAEKKKIELNIPDNIGIKIFELGAQRNDSLEGIYKNRDKYLEEIFTDNKQNLEVFEKVVQNKYIFPRSAIFTSLGSPEKITIVRGRR
ncbi:CHAT domain-containing protein [Bacillus cereus]